jgi:UDP-N-acetylmuramoylalanine--D-glutamate ligase
VTASDLKTREQLGDQADHLQAAATALVLGEHPLAMLDDADLLFVSPGVPLDTPLLLEAQSRGLPLSTESRLFCQLCPAPVVAVTGSSGKTTTTTLLGMIMEADGRQTWLGGNIGRPLIEVVDEIKPADVVVVELSSFQLEYFHAWLNQGVDVDEIPSAKPQQLADLLGNWSPPIGAILNITPNHLDRHPSMKHYVRAKRAIIDYQQDEDVLILSLDNDMTRTIGNQFEARVGWFSTEAHVPGGAGIMGDALVLFDQDCRPQPVAKVTDIQLRGLHNLRNILAACLLAREAGASIEAMHQVITTFSGVEHRLQLVRELNGVGYYDDSIATTPERQMAALHAFNEPVVLLAGGRDKNLPWEDAAWLMLHKVTDVILFGEAATIIGEAIDQVRAHPIETKLKVHRGLDLEEAVRLAAKLARPGEVVLLSPGCASYDAFGNFVERGDSFRELVWQL